MANETTLAELWEMGVEHADMVGSELPNITLRARYANAGLSRLHNALAGADYFRETKSYTLVSGTEAYALPSDYMKCMRVWRTQSSRRYEVERFNLSQISGYKTTGPVSALTMELWYIPQLTRLRKDSDPVMVALPEGWEDYVSLHIAVRLAIKAEDDTLAALRAERAEALADIMAHIEPRDEGQQDTVEDVNDRWGHGLRDETGRNVHYRIMGNQIHFVEFHYLGV